MKKLSNSKKSQLFLISCTFFLLGLIFIYSIETDNSYITGIEESIIIKNIKYETCQIGLTSNGTNMENYFTKYQTMINTNCQTSLHNCNLQITPKPSLPSNKSLITKTHFTYNLTFQSSNLNSSSSFTC